MYNGQLLRSEREWRLLSFSGADQYFAGIRLLNQNYFQRIEGRHTERKK